VCVCVYVCVVCVCVCVHACACVCACSSALCFSSQKTPWMLRLTLWSKAQAKRATLPSRLWYVYLHTYVRVYVHQLLSVHHTCVFCTDIACLSVQYVRTYICTYVHNCIYCKYVHMYVRTCIRAYVRTCGPVCIQSIIHTYIHTWCCEAPLRLRLCVTCAAGVRSEHSTGAAVHPAPWSARPVHGKVLPKATGVPVSTGLVVCTVGCGIGGGPCKDPAACVMCIRHLMDKLKAAFKEVMQPQQKRQLGDDTLVKTMKVRMYCIFLYT